MDVNLKGVHTVRKKLSDGTVKLYFYAWRGGPRLEGEPGDVAFLRSYNEAHASKAQSAEYVVPGTLKEATARFKASADFTKLATLTQREYSRYLAMINAEFGGAKIAAFNDPQMRGEIKDWRDDMRDTPRAADYAVSVLKRLLSWLFDNGELTYNAAAKLGRLHRSNRADVIWTDADHAAMERIETPLGARMAWAVKLGCLTGLRRSNLVALPYEADQGDYFDWTTNKTHRRVIIPILPELRTLLDEMPETTGPILRGVKGEPMTPDGFSSNFDAVTDKAKVTKRIHDMRGTFATRLALAGVEDREIAGIIGWSMERVAEIRRIYVDANSLALRTAKQLHVNQTVNHQPLKGAK